MSRPRLKIASADVATLEAALRKDERYYQGIRLYAVLQIAKGGKARELAPVFGTTFKSITSWVHRFNEGGIEALKDKPRAGRPSRLSASQQSRLKAIILDESPEQHGFNSGTWSGPLIAALIKGLFEVSYGKAQVYNLLHSLGLSHQKGKAFYPETTTEENALMREALKKTPMP